jgi:DNA polymerase III subunit epsilon
MTKTYVVCDTETGGLDANKNALVSIAIVELDENLEEIGRHYTLVKDDPDKIIEQQALDINGITLAQIEKKGKPVAEVMERVKELFADAIIVCHNAAFDIAFTNARGTNVLEAIDTMDLAWKRWPGKTAKLGIVCERLGFSIKNAHNSLSDTLATVDVLKKFAEDKSLNALKPYPIIFNRFKK